MAVRVPTLLASTQGVNLLTQLNRDLLLAQEQIATGRRIVTPADDPAGAARAVSFRESISQIQQFTRNAETVESRLQFSEQTLTAVVDVVQRTRELTIQAANSTQSNESRAAIAAELRENLKALVDLANTRDGAGRYLYAGFADRVEPFTAGAGGIAYVGDDGQRSVRISENRYITDGDPGGAVFMAIPESNGVFTSEPAPGNTGSGIVAAQTVDDAAAYDGGDYTVRFLAADSYEVVDSASVVVATGSFTPGDSVAFNGVRLTVDGQPAAGDEFDLRAAGQQSIFATLEQLATALESGSADQAGAAALASTLNRGLENLDQALSGMTDVRTAIGSRLLAIETQIDVNAEAELQTRSTLGDIEDIDYTEAATRLAQNLTALEAAQQSFIQIQGLSLFDLLR